MVLKNSYGGKRGHSNQVLAALAVAQTSLFTAQLRHSRSRRDTFLAERLTFADRRHVRRRVAVHHLPEAEVLVNALGGVIFRIDDERAGGDLPNRFLAAIDRALRAAQCSLCLFVAAGTSGSGGEVVERDGRPGNTPI